MIKKYTANSHVCISVRLGNGGNMHVSFSPLTGGKSVLVTGDEQLQKALAQHPRYGKLFREDKSFVQEQQRQVEKAAKKEEAPQKLSVQVVKVAAWDDAKEYLVDNYGMSRTKLRSHIAIETAAAARGIKFEGLQ